MKSTPPIARFSTSLVFGAVWPMYCPPDHRASPQPGGPCARNPDETGSRPCAAPPWSYRPGVAGEAHVQAGRLRLQPQVSCAACRSQQRGDVTDARFDRCKAHQVAVRARPSPRRPGCAPALRSRCRASADCGPWAAVAPVAGSGTGDAVPAALPGIEYSGEPTSSHLVAGDERRSS